MKNSFDIIGNIAVVKFDKKTKKTDKLKSAKKLIENNKNITTVVEKTEKIKGRLRTWKTTHIFGKKTKETLYRENECWFKLNIDETYFSPRLSNERKEIANQVKKNETVLVLFAGVAPFSIVIAKLAKPKIVYSVEINRKASKYAKENAQINRLNDKVEIIQGDAKLVVPKLKQKRIKFDRIVMPRPQLKETFLKQAFSVIKSKGIINYYGFSDDPEKIKDQIQTQAKLSKKKIKILKIKKAGEIAPYRYRWGVDFKVN